MVERHSFIEWKYAVCAHRNCLYEAVASMRQLQCVPTTYVTEIKETYFEIYIYQKSCSLALTLLNISICLLVLKYLTIFGKLFIFT